MVRFLHFSYNTDMFLRNCCRLCRGKWNICTFVFFNADICIAQFWAAFFFTMKNMRVQFCAYMWSFLLKKQHVSTSTFTNIFENVVTLMDGSILLDLLVRHILGHVAYQTYGRMTASLQKMLAAFVGAGYVEVMLLKRFSLRLKNISKNESIKMACKPLWPRKNTCTHFMVSPAN